MRQHKSTPPIKKKNADVRVREYLFPHEIDTLITAAKLLGRHGHRDATMILIAYRHGLRVSELVNLQWSQFDMHLGVFSVHRAKNGIDTTHPLTGIELRALRKIEREYTETSYVFVTERHTPMTTSTFRKIVARAGEQAGFSFRAHPHMLRHATGFKLANDGHDTRAIQHYLGHKNIQHTVIYTQMSAERFQDFWKD